MKFKTGQCVKKYKSDKRGYILSYEGNGQYLVKWEDEPYPWMESTYALEMR